VLLNQPLSVDVRRLAGSLLAAALVFAFCLVPAGLAVGATFDPEKIISDDNMRAYDCMSQADIQAFLDTQTGPLKTLVIVDYQGKVKKPASQIIAEACRQWHISPRVMLTLLQREQGLLTGNSKWTAAELAHRLERAIGAGCPNGSTNKYPGFGNQMWNGARLLDGYGEGKNGSTIALWKSPYTKYAGVNTRNLATYKLFVYNPVIGAKSPYGDLASQSSKLTGNALFWWVYRRHFGDTFANPAKRTVYRFRDKKRGHFVWTASQSERYRLLRNKKYKYEAVAFSYNTSTTINPCTMYRFYNRKNGGFLYTSSRSQRDTLKSPSKAKRWRYDGTAFMTSRNTSGTIPVYMFKNRKTGFPFFSTSLVDKKKYSAKAYRKKWVYKGIGFRVAK
jgi:hypothetical protein